MKDETTFLLLTALLLAPQTALQAADTGNRPNTVITSPNGKLAVTAGMDESGAFTYAFEANGRKLISPSQLGLDFGPAGKIPRAGWKPLQTTDRQVNSTWKPLWGKRAVVPDHYQERSWDLAGSDAPFDRMTVTLRVYDDGIAFRYSIPADAKGQSGKAIADLTEYNFAGDFTAWFYNGEQHNLGPDKLSTLDGKREPVMTVQAAENAFLAVHEADLRTGEPLRLGKSGPTSFRALTAPGEIAPGYAGPWRVIFFGDTPGAMVDSHLIELLNPDPTGDFSWVNPGVAVWDWRINGAEIPGFKYGMNLPSWIRMVDFAVSNEIKHLVLDANWYGPEHKKESDPVKGDKVGDVRKLIAYGKSRNVGIWLYLNDVGGRQFPLEETLAHYAEWGAVGVKYGFMRGSPEEKNRRTRLITELCAKNQLLCNFHDGPVHPYGQMRTWPNAVTREFCFAQLDGKRVFQPKTFVSSVFINMLAGPLDMNNGFFDLRQGRTTRVDNPQECPSTLVAEAARTLITFSGATIIPDIPEFYQKYPDLLRFIASQQMPWRESKTLSGVIGEHIVMARQSARGVWLVGAANNEQARKLDIKLDFLPEGSYDATIVQDGEDGHYQTNRETLRTENRRVTASETIHVTLAPGGGACVILAPTKESPKTGGAQDPPQQQHYTPPADLRGQWEFVPDPKLPNVLILGDSISIAYTLDVRKNLRGKANVFRPMQPDRKPQNCGDTPRGLAMLDEWLGDTRWDLIHFNWGLWDLCYRHPQSKEQGGRDKVRGKLTTTPENYERNLEKLVTRLKTTGAKLIWANITVVPEGEAGRFVGDDIKYNAIAARVMERHHIPVNDLHRTSKSFPPELFSGPGDVHFTNEGSAQLARQVAECISNALEAR